MQKGLICLVESLYRVFIDLLCRAHGTCLGAVLNSPTLNAYNAKNTWNDTHVQCLLM